MVKKLSILAIFTSLFLLLNSFFSNKTSNSYIIYVKSGESLRGLVKNINENTDLNVNYYVARAVFSLFFHKNIKKGEYFIPKGSSITNFYDIIVSGNVIKYYAKIPEGLTSTEIVELINLDKNFKTEDVKEKFPEGTLLPETYQFERDTPRLEIISKMQKSMTDFVDKEWELRDADLPIKTKEEAVILASVIEKETSIESERRAVAGLFYNRMKSKMRLQSDPTAIYEITKGKYKMLKPLTREDLKTKGFYNTYVIKSIPIGPICNPGKSSILAVLHPQKHNYTYFVAKGDGSKEHFFTEDYKGHLDKVKEYKSNLSKQK